MTMRHSNHGAQDRAAFFDLINRFCDHVFVITLKRAVYRQQHIARELAGLNFEWFWGHDKADFDMAELAEKGVYNEALAMSHHRYGKAMTSGMLGCSWSHLDVYKTIIERGYKRVLILEDDVVINWDQAGLLPAILQQVPETWELLYWGFAKREKAPLLAPVEKGYYHVLSSLGAVKLSHATIRNFYPRKVAPNLYRAGWHDCSHAYTITASAAKTLLQLQSPISFWPDHLLAHAVTNKLVEGYVMQPKLINTLIQEGIDLHSFVKE